MAGLQANQIFSLPSYGSALLTISDIIFGVTILSPETGNTIGSITLPAFDLGVQGLVYGVIIGACLHLAIQIPGLIKYRFRWTPSINLRNLEVRKVLRLMGPRLLTMFCIQLVFLIRDNLASRLAAGAVTSLTYGWMIQQVPETLIGTAIGTALLPTLSEHYPREDKLAFTETVQKAVKVLIALTLPIAVVLSIGLKPLLGLAFDFGERKKTTRLNWVTDAFMLVLLGHSLKEVIARSLLARQMPGFTSTTAGIHVVLYVVLACSLPCARGTGIALTDSIVLHARSSGITHSAVKTR